MVAAKPAGREEVDSCSSVVVAEAEGGILLEAAVAGTVGVVAEGVEMLL